jgi:hypothetical protein
MMMMHSNNLLIAKFRMLQFGIYLQSVLHAILLNLRTLTMTIGENKGILESMIMARATLYFTNSLLLVGHPFSIYMKAYAKAGGEAALEGRTSRPYMAREFSQVGHARLGLEHSPVSLRCSDSFT